MREQPEASGKVQNGRRESVNMVGAVCERGEQGRGQMVRLAGYKEDGLIAQGREASELERVLENM